MTALIQFDDGQFSHLHCRDELVIWGKLSRKPKLTMHEQQTDRKKMYCFEAKLRKTGNETWKTAFYILNK